jgi:hypothetical protein
MRNGGILFAAVWTGLAAYALVGGWLLGGIEFPPPPVPFMLFALVLALIFPSVVMRILGIGFKRLVVPRGAPRAYVNFVERFEIPFAPAVLCLLAGTSMLLSTYLSTQSIGAYFMGGFAFVLGIGYFAAYLLSMKFPSAAGNR